MGLWLGWAPPLALRVLRCPLQLLLLGAACAGGAGASSASRERGVVPFNRKHLCVFIPFTTRTSKDVALVRAALRTWASNAAQMAAGAQVRFIGLRGMNATDIQRHVLHVPGDIETDWGHLPIRILKMWAHLGSALADDCDWYMKADPDTYMSLQNVADRLACFDSEQPHYLGVTHATVPAAGLQDMFGSLYFGQGGIGYVVSRGLIRQVGEITGYCLASLVETTKGISMEDVIFAVCLKQIGVEVTNYGFLAHGVTEQVLAMHDDHTLEFVLNFHQTKEALFKSSDGSPLQRSFYWDAQPPPIHGCLLVVHPVDDPEDLEHLHRVVSDPDGPRARPAGGCTPSPMQLSQQSVVSIRAPGSKPKPAWDHEVLVALDRCFQQRRGAPPRCDWEPLILQCYGLTPYSAAASAPACEAACCRSGEACSVFQFKEDLGCWLGGIGGGCQIVEGTEEHGWQGGIKFARSW